MTYTEVPPGNTPLLADSAPARPQSAAETHTDGGRAVLLPLEGHRLVPLLCWLAVILTLVLVPFRILGHGFLPFDDALRHAAKVVSGVEWSDVILLQDQFKMDHSPGWHWLLGVVHRATGLGVDGLVVGSLCTLLFLFTMAPLGWIRRPEAWIGSLLLGMVFFPTMLCRFYLARPFVFSATATCVIFLLWRKGPKPTALLAAITTILFGLAAWIHGSWYLSSIVVAAFAFAGQWRSALCLGGCWLGGSFLGALLTGHPFGFLWNAIHIGISCFGTNELQRMLVAEFQPNNGAPLTVLLAVGILGVRALSGGWNWSAVKNPLFMMFVLCWVLSFRVTRFWEDWGLPAFSLWIALELHDHFKRYLSPESFRRLFITGALCVAFFFATTGDIQSRWTRTLDVEFLSESDPEMDAWLPEDGGIIYNSDMSVFYFTFFKNPHAKWKYALGFEPALMLPENLRIYRNIQRNYMSAEAHQPWVAKMRPEDRMIITSFSPGAPNVVGLEWKLVARKTWIGRLPRVAQAAAPASSTAAN